jgi:type III pantothenate kinase
MHLIIDQGNTYNKVGLFEQHELLRAERLSDDELALFIAKEIDAETTPCFFSSVRASHNAILSLLPQSKCMEPGLRLPFTNSYTTPNTLGTDRLADVAGAIFLYPNKSLLVVDAGTCITYNVVVKGCFVGGAISPGINMRLKAMHEFTGKLPLITATELPAINSQSTKDSLLNGAMRGTLAEVKSMADYFCSENGPLHVIVTGGDASFLADHLESPIFAVPFLTLIGLNEIFLFNSN